MTALDKLRYGTVNDKIRVLNHTELLIKKVYGSKDVEIIFNQDEDAIKELKSQCAQVHIFDQDGKIIGVVCLKDIESDGLEEEGLEILRLILEGLVRELQQIDLLNEVIDTERKQYQEVIIGRQELELAYDDLNLAHEELSESVNLATLLNRNLSRSRIAVKTFLEQAPIAFAILRHRNLKIEVANSMILRVWGKEKTVIGKPLAHGLPELHGQPYLGILDEVYTSGIRYVGNEEKVMLAKEGKMEEVYFNFIYEPLKNVRGQISSIMIIATDVTELVKNRQMLIDSNLDKLQ